MLLGIKTKREITARHLAVGALAAVAVAAGWQLNASWDPEMRLCVKGHLDLPMGGHETSPPVDSRAPRRRT